MEKKRELDDLAGDGEQKRDVNNSISGDADPGRKSARYRAAPWRVFPAAPALCE